jgi:hypothetical protein
MQTASLLWSMVLVYSTFDGRIRHIHTQQTAKVPLSGTDSRDLRQELNPTLSAA